MFYFSTQSLLISFISFPTSLTFPSTQNKLTSNVNSLGIRLVSLQGDDTSPEDVALVSYSRTPRQYLETRHGYSLFDPFQFSEITL